MSTVQHNQTKRAAGRPPKRGILARPLDSLVFLLPLVFFYEGASRFDPGGMVPPPDRVIAFALIQRFLELFGQFGLWAPAAGLIVILLTTHAVSGEKWRIHWREVGLMVLEAPAMAIPLLLLNRAIPLRSAIAEGASLPGQLALGIGAGVYEEMVFRLILISLVVMIGADLLKRDRTWVAITAVAVSALVFAAHHHRPVGLEPFELTRFTFRTLAGVYLAMIFWYRGYGPAAGCHAAYNAALVVLAALEE